MNDSAHMLAESKYFLMWVGIWVLALALLVPCLR